MRLNLLFAVVALFLQTTVQAATILQTKAKTAIVELSPDEFDELNPTVGQKFFFTLDSQKVAAMVTKISKNKILIKTNTDLTGQQNAEVEINPSATNRKEYSAYANSSSNSKQKPWTFGVNVKYVTGTAKVKYADVVVGSITIAGSTSTQNVTGFDLSGVGFYYFGNLGIGGELEYASLKGADSNITTTATQMQASVSAEYKISDFSAGALFTFGSNFKASDNLNNSYSINGMGFGVFATYQVIPDLRAIVDYRMINYTLDSNAVDTSDIRVGAGYYF